MSIHDTAALDSAVTHAVGCGAGTELEICKALQAAGIKVDLRGVKLSIRRLRDRKIIKLAPPRWFVI